MCKLGFIHYFSLIAVAQTILWHPHKDHPLLDTVPSPLFAPLNPFCMSYLCRHKRRPAHIQHLTRRTNWWRHCPWTLHPLHPKTIIKLLLPSINLTSCIHFWLTPFTLSRARGCGPTQLMDAFKLSSVVEVAFSKSSALHSLSEAHPAIETIGVNSETDKGHLWDVWREGGMHCDPPHMFKKK